MSHFREKIEPHHTKNLLSLVTRQLLGNVFKTFQNGWILVEMLSFVLVVFRFFLMEFQLLFIHENQQLKTNIIVADQCSKRALVF